MTNHEVLRKVFRPKEGKLPGSIKDREFLDKLGAISFRIRS
jgi:hypothetical protein